MMVKITFWSWLWWWSDLYTVDCKIARGVDCDEEVGDAHCDPEAGTPGFGAVSYNNHDGGGDGDGGDGGDGDGGHQTRR